MSDIRSIHVLSDEDASAIRKALNLHMLSVLDVYIDGVPVPKQEVYSSIMKKLPQKGIGYTATELIVIQGCFVLYSDHLPKDASKRVLNAIRPCLAGTYEEEKP